MCISIWPQYMTCPAGACSVRRLPEKHETPFISELPERTSTGKRPLVTRPCHSQTCIGRGAKLGPWRKPNHDHRPLSLARATHHFRLIVPNGGIHHWRGWSKDKRGRLEARGGAQMAHADRQRSRRSCVLIAGVCTRCLVRCSPYPFGAQCLPNGYECERRAIHGLLHMQERV